MRRKDKEITDPEIIGEILHTAQICRIGLVDEGEAYIVPVNYAYDKGFIYIHSAPAGKKIELIRQNPKVSFEIEGFFEVVKDEIPCKWTARYRSLMGKGLVTLENDPEARRRGMDLIMRKYGAENELKYDEAVLSRTILLKMEVLSVTGKQSGTW